MEINTSMCNNNPLHLYSYEIRNSKLVLKVINCVAGKIDSLEVGFIDQIYNIDINCDDEYFDVEININDSHFISKPKILSAVINGKKIEFDYSNEHYITRPNSVSKFGREQFLFKNKMSTRIGVDKKKIKFIPSEGENNWYCVCGTCNFNSQTKCINCGLKRKRIFSQKIDMTKQAEETRNIINLHKVMLPYLAITLFIQIIIIPFFLGGNLFFENSDLNEFFAVLNRVISPILVVLGTILFFIGKSRYQKILWISGDVIRYASLIYMNTLLIFKFVLTSYNYIVTILYDFIFIVYFVFLIIKKCSKKYEYPILLVNATSLIAGIVFPIMYGNNNLVVSSRGLTYHVKENVKDCYLPERINNEIIRTLVFDEAIDYSQIETLHLNKYIENVYCKNNYIPNLKKIILDEDNTSLKVVNEVLLNDEKTVLVPNGLKEITISWPTVSRLSFSNLTNLEVVNFADAVTTIDQESFENCTALKNLNFELNSSLTKISSYAFKGCLSLENVVLPKSLTNVGECIFSSCTGIKNLTLPFLGMKRYETYDNLNQNYLGYYFGYGTDLATIIPELELDSLTLTNQAILQASCFYGAKVKSYYINDISGVLPMNAFAYNTFEEFKVPNGVTTIKKDCFFKCTNLQKVTIPSSVTYIEKDAFEGCSNLTKIIYEGDISTLEFEDINDSIQNIISNN